MRWSDSPVFFNDAVEWCEENNMSLASLASGKDFVKNTEPGKPTWVGLQTTTVMLWYNGMVTVVFWFFFVHLKEP